MNALQIEYSKLTNLICLWKLSLCDLGKVENIIISMIENKKENEVINQLLYNLDCTSISNYFKLF